MTRLTLIALALMLCSVGWGRSERDRREVRAFRAEHACPSTMKHRGPCVGFHVDHVTPLCSGGRDHRSNMQWISVEDHRFKTMVDVRECRKARTAVRSADSP